MTETFNPDQHLMKLKNKDYLEVKWRIVWMLQATSPCAGYVTIELEHSREHGYARYAAIAWDGSDETWRTIKMYGTEVQVCGRMGMGTKTETRADFPDFTEKAETGALGRALAGIGFGTQFSPDVEEGARIVDTPVQRQQPPQRPATPPQQPAQQPLMHAPEPDKKLPDQGAPATEQQMLSIRKLCVALGREEPASDAGLTFVTASDLIRRLSREYNQKRQAS